MDYSVCFHDGNIGDLINSRILHGHHHDFNFAVQMHSSLIRRLSLARELEGHHGCVNAIAWNSRGSMLISGSDDTQINIWSYATQKLMHSIETGHSANIFCTKFIPETSDELVVSGAADAEVRLFNLSRLRRSRLQNGIAPLAVFQSHTRRVKKLAVEAGNPNMVWSASEDGTLRQHDLREGVSFPPSGSSHQGYRNILLDLRCGAKKTLADRPKPSLALKSCDISPTRPHLVLVGGSDTFARLYDRRMLRQLSSSQNTLSPPPCVNYFCPMHLSDLGRSGVHLTHVAFSPNGEEVLLSYSGEHVYLMDVDNASGSSMRYTPADVSKLISLSPIPILDKGEVNSSLSGASLNGFPAREKTAAAIDKCRKLIQIAEKSLKEEIGHYYGIEACNEVLDGHGREIGPTLMHDCLCTRASLLLKRKWRSDTHMAIKDSQRARKINPSSARALICMAEALSMLEKHKEALEFAIASRSIAPSDFEIMEVVEKIKKNIAAADKTDMESERGSKANNRARRVLSLSDIIYHTEGDNDALIDDPERQDSDYDEELELDFEASIPTEEEERDIDPNALPTNLNLRIHRIDDSIVETERLNGSCEASGSCENDEVPYQPEMAIDMKRRYVGHCNIGTDIKQASFIGQRGEYVASGSDDGRWFIWEKKTGRLIKMLRGDDAVVNCIQSHPHECVIATSGIDSTIKLWSPNSPVPSIVAGGVAGPETLDVLDAMEGNQNRLSRNREALLYV
ncbi:hypothetical protein CASFOL_034535 [Castilleja foliolosa]|uniref:WD and tetratricopeptide repeats protein 1 n=1 Tax=Castilleja foliolosa TaxID=1961234 RepID=A0ABD3BQW8_9LAMI